VHACVRACVCVLLHSSFGIIHKDCNKTLKCRTATYFIFSCSQRIFNYCLGDYLGNILKKNVQLFTNNVNVQHIWIYRGVIKCNKYLAHFVSILSQNFFLWLFLELVWKKCMQVNYSEKKGNKIKHL